MPFSNTNSLTATDLNNCYRGLYRDNTNRSVTGTTSETDLGSLTITGGTISATGRIVLEAAGTITGAAGTKRLRVYFGGTSLYDSTAAAGTADWFVRLIISNTASNAQRVSVEAHDHTNTTNYLFDYTTAAIDTASNAILKITGTLGNTGDTITEAKFEVQVQQIT